MSWYLEHPGSVRASQILTTFGPGSIYDNLKDSFLIMGLDYWKKENYEELTGETLLSNLKRNGKSFQSLSSFRVARPTEEEEKHIQVETFPKWGICNECNSIQERNFVERKTKCKIENCKSVVAGAPENLEPVRLVTACIDGHLDEFPWYDWAHQNSKNECNEDDAILKLIDEHTSSGMESKKIVCSCKAEEPLTVALSEIRFRGKCRGNQPWIHQTHGCEEYPIGLYKGASNLYFANLVRAITVPPFVGEDARKIVKLLDGSTIKEKNPSDMLEKINAIKTLLSTVNEKIISKVVEKYYEINSESQSPSIHKQEFSELNSDEPVITEDFITEPSGVPEFFKKFGMTNLVKIKKLREVIAQTGFNRIEPYSYDETETRRQQYLGSIAEKDWLPAGINLGEGIFISFDDSMISSWMNQPRVIGQFSDIMHHRKRKIMLVDKVEVNPRYILLHTLSHLLQREIYQNSGYFPSSIRERIYSGQGMAGILIYTSSQSSDGSLGGLVEQGDRDRFGIIMRKSMAMSKLCSSDPFCSSAKPENVNLNNGAACHSCLLISETSCECMNNFLDRSMIRSTLSKKGMGFFDESSDK